jgi:L-cysteine/cystine lyase
MTFDVRAVREALPAAREAAYLNAGTFGPLPSPAAAAMRAHLDSSFERGRIGHAGLERWLRLMDETRAGFARTLHARADDVALMHCTTDGCDTVVWGLPWNAGDEIVTTTHEHPGLTAPLEELARVRGVSVKLVEPRASAIVDAIGPRTRLLAISHVLWTNGDVLPLAELSQVAHDRGALVLIDGAQSVGAIDVDPDALGADFYTASGQKWLCGPSGTGALWVRPSALGQLGTPWPWYLSKARGPTGVQEWTNARRLDTTTIGMTSLAGIVASLAWHEAQVAAGAHAYAASLAQRLRARLAELANVEIAEASRPSQLVSFSVRGESAGAVARRLEGAGVLVRSIPGFEWVRASVGFWNDDGDLDRLLAALRG